MEEFLDFFTELTKCRTQCLSRVAPTVMHSPDGIGSTGVLGLFEILTEKIEAGLIPDAKQILLHLRSQKPGLCANASHYAFAIRAAIAFTQRLPAPSNAG